MLITKKVTAAVYREILQQSNSRYFFNQMPEFGELKIAEGNKVEYLVFYQDDVPLACALVVYYQYKKILRYANCIFGPVLFSSEPELLGKVAEALKSVCFKSLRTRSIRINPLIPANIYQDIKLIRNDVGDSFIEQITKSGYRKINREWYKDQSISIRCIYSKTVDNLSYDQVLASLVPNFKLQIRKAEQFGVKVRMLKYEELDIFNNLLEKTYARLNTELNVRHDFNRHLYQYFKENIYFPVAYIDCKEAKNNYERIEADLKTDLARLTERFADNLNNKKYLNQTRDFNDQFQRLAKLRKKIDLLQKEQGDIIYLYAGCFIASGQDFIHLLGGGGEKELADFNGVHATHAHMLKLAIEKGFKYYNLYGCSDLLDEEKNNVDWGVIKFKCRFQGQFEEFIGTFEYRR